MSRDRLLEILGTRVILSKAHLGVRWLATAFESVLRLKDLLTPYWAAETLLNIWREHAIKEEYK